MEMTQKERRELVREIASAVVRMLDNKKKTGTEPDEWLTSKEAAKLLGISVSHLWRIKDRFPHTKQGDYQAGHLRFLKSGLMEGYING